MNDVVVIQAAQGLLVYLQNTIPNVSQQGIVLDYDGRHYSKRFGFVFVPTFLLSIII